MMFIRSFLVLLAVLSFSVQAADVHGVKLGETAVVEGSPLVLNGAGVRTKMVFKVYVAALYLKEKKSGADAVLLDSGPKRVSLHFLRELSAEKLTNAMDEGLAANNSTADLSALEVQMKDFRAMIASGGAVREGNEILLDYVPGAGTAIILNKIEKGVIPGENFNRALLKVWLGEHPVDSALKKALLGN